MIRDAATADFSAIVELNDTVVSLTSPMDVARLRELDAISCYHRVVETGGRIGAFLLAMGERAPYVNDNYNWFSKRFQRFVYIDRIVVGSTFTGQGIGRDLYRDLFSYVRSIGIETVACEYNITPPNIASQRFHERFGFAEHGRRWVAGGIKQVSLQVASVGPSDEDCQKQIPYRGR